MIESVEEERVPTTEYNTYIHKYFLYFSRLVEKNFLWQFSLHLESLQLDMHN